MRVLFITTSFPLTEGDTHGTFVERLARALARHDHAVDVLAPHALGALRHQLLGDVRVSRARYVWPARMQTLAYGYGIPENLRQSPARAVQAPFLLLSLLLHGYSKARRADVLHAHWTPSGAVALVLGAIARRPVVVTIWGSDVRSLSPRFNRWVLRNADAVIGLSAEMQAAAERLGVEARSIPPPMDLVRFHSDHDVEKLRSELGLTSTDRVVTFVGRLAQEKGVDTLIEAVPYLTQLVPDACVFIVGTGPLKDRLTKRIVELGCKDSLRLVGARPDVERYLAVADVFVTPSPLENVWSTTITEATLCGVPTVMTTAGHTTEVFTDQVDAVLVPPSDPQGLARGLAQVLVDGDLRDRLVANCLDLHRRHGYDNDDIVEQHLDLYASVVGSRQPTP